MLGTLFAREPVIVQYLASGEASLSFLTPAEASHMNDVREVLASGVRWFTLAVLVLFLYAQTHGITRRLARDATIMSGVLIMLLIPFSYSFTWFHNAFFPQGNWQFAADSWLIMHFPVSFFATYAFAWLAFSALLLGLLWKELPQ